MKLGYISQIIGPVVDVCFKAEEKQGSDLLPRIHDALELVHPDGRKIVIEVQQHIGEDTVRCVAMDNTDGLKRGLEVKSLEAPISMPVGEQIKGRMMNASLAVEYDHQCAWASGVVARELIFPVACGIFLDQGSHSCLLHWQAEFFTTEPPGKHQGQSVF